MNARDRQDFLQQAHLAEVMRIVEEATSIKIPEEPRGRLWMKLEGIAKWTRDFQVMGLVFTILLTILGAGFGSRPLMNTSITVSVLTTCLGLLIVLLMMAAFLPELAHVVKNPGAAFARNVKRNIEASSRFADMLVACNKDELKYVLLLYKAERAAMERRCAFMAGAIDKMGLIPGLAAFVVVAVAIAKVQNDLVQQLIYLVPAFYLLSFLASLQFEKYDRVIVLLEFALDRHKEKNSES